MCVRVCCDRETERQTDRQRKPGRQIDRQKKIPPFRSRSATCWSNKKGAKIMTIIVIIIIVTTTIIVILYKQLYDLNFV